MKIKKIIFVILSALIFAIMLAVLELNKNTVWGFVLLLLVTAGFYTAHRFIVKRKNKWYLRLCVWLAWLSLFCGVLLLTWPPVQAVPAVSVKNPEGLHARPAWGCRCRSFLRDSFSMFRSFSSEPGPSSTWRDWLLP